MKHISLTAVAAAAIIVSSCSGSNDKWRIHGTIDGLSDTDIVLLEGNNQGGWYTIDTIKPDSKGRFDYSHAPQGYPDIYRLRTGTNSLYFPIDSVETVTITATAPDIMANHTISGSTEAENLAKVDSMLAVSAAQKGPAGVIADEELKRELGKMILADPDGIVAYYAISKKIDGKPLFNPSVSLDHRIIGAVANSFTSNRPSDPRTTYLKKLYLDNRRPSGAAPANTIEAQEVGSFELKLYDRKGVERSLHEITEKGRPVILNFTAYTAEWSPAFNIVLNKVYEKYRSQGVEIYQVSLDTDEYAWKQTAANLPWICVLNNLSTDGNINLINYNVTAIPTTYVINRQGVISERVSDISELDRAVASVM